MSFLTDIKELKKGLILFRRTDVQHKNWYCRIKLLGEDRYKIFSLKTPDINVASEKAFDHDAEIRFRVKHEVPIFNKPFSQIAKDFAEFQEKRSQAKEITDHRVRVMKSHIKSQLDPYIGSVQINLIGEDRWKGYPFWRKKDKMGRCGAAVSDGTIRSEMATFRAIMAYAASKKYIPENHVFKGKLPLSKVRREEFTPEEYRKLHTFARGWIKNARDNELNIWYRNIVYNFILIMTNTGMRPSEARNLRWRDVMVKTDKQGRKLVILSVSGKGKSRQLVAASTVADYLDRIKAIARKKEDNDPVFTNFQGESAFALYHNVLKTLLTESGLLKSSTGKQRSTYCFRHTYATFRLTEGVDVYFLAKQMGTSVKMIEDHYGHITPVKNADRILQGLPGWEPIEAASQSSSGSVNTVDSDAAFA